MTGKYVPPRKKNTQPPTLSIASRLQDNCCGSLLGTAEKAAIIAEITALEVEHATLTKVVAKLLEDIKDLEIQSSYLVSEVFHKTYVGKPVDKKAAWLKLCAELGIRA